MSLMSFHTVIIRLTHSVEKRYGPETKKLSTQVAVFQSKTQELERVHPPHASPLYPQVLNFYRVMEKVRSRMIRFIPS